MEQARPAHAADASTAVHQPTFERSPLLAPWPAHVTAPQLPDTLPQSSAPAMSDSDDRASLAEKRSSGTPAASRTKASKARMRVKKRAFHQGLNCRSGPPGLSQLPDLPVKTEYYRLDVWDDGLWFTADSADHTNHCESLPTATFAPAEDTKLEETTATSLQPSTSPAAQNLVTTEF